MYIYTGVCIYIYMYIYPGLPHCRWIFYQLSHKGSPRILEWVAYPFFSGSSWPRNQTRVSCIAGWFYTNWVMREAHNDYVCVCVCVCVCKLWCWRRLLKVPWTARRSNQSILNRSVLGVHWKDWCWSWNSNTLATSCEELTHWKRLWCWKGLGAGGEGDNRGWDGWMASPTQWTCIWVNSGSWWWTGSPGVLQFMGLQRVRHYWKYIYIYICVYICIFFFHPPVDRHLACFQTNIPRLW